MASTMLPPSLAGSTPGRDEELRRGLLYFVGVPLIIGVLFGWIRASRTGAWDLLPSIGYWVAISFAGWILCDLGSRLAGRVLRPRGAPLWVVLALGGGLIQPALFPVNSAIAEFFQSNFVPAALHAPLPELRWAAAIKSLVPGLAIWVSVNLAMLHLLGVPRYGYRPRPQPGFVPADVQAIALPAKPTFMARVPAELGEKLLALSAEEHYLRVTTDRGSTHVLYRMSDAVRELAGWPGLQVHRSHWVARDAVVRAERHNGQVSLVLRNGVKIPVSRSFRKKAEESGLL